MRRAVADFELIRYIDTAENELIAVCGACRLEVTLDVAEIIREHGANMSIGELRERLQCRGCGERAASVLSRQRRVVQF